MQVTANPRLRRAPGRWGRLMLIAAVASAVTAMGGPQRATATANPFDIRVTPLEVGDRMPATQFVDQRGRPVTFAALQGRTVAVGFVYTRCRDACPLITQKFAALGRELGPAPYHLVEVSIDPERDSVSSIAAYARKYGADSVNSSLLTGDPAKLRGFWREAGVAVIDNGKGELIHNDRVLIVAPDGKLADIITLVAWSPRQLAAEMKHVAGSPSSAWERANLALTKAVAQYCGGSYQIASGIIDVAAALLVLAGGVLVLYFLRRHMSAQGA